MNVDQQNRIDNYIIQAHTALNKAIENDNLPEAKRIICHINQQYNPALKEHILNLVTRSGTLLDRSRNRYWSVSESPISQLLINNGAVTKEEKIARVNHFNNLCRAIANDNLNNVRQILGSINSNSKIHILNQRNFAGNTPLDIANIRLNHHQLHNNLQGERNLEFIIGLLT